jgi:hypothetical protein
MQRHNEQTSRVHRSRIHTEAAHTWVQAHISEHTTSPGRKGHLATVNKTDKTRRTHKLCQLSRIYTVVQLLSGE